MNTERQRQGVYTSKSFETGGSKCSVFSVYEGSSFEASLAEIIADHPEELFNVQIFLVGGQYGERRATIIVTNKRSVKAW